MYRALLAAGMGIALSGIAVASEKTAPEPKRVYAIESYDLVCKDDRPTIIARVTVNSGGWSAPTAISPGGPPVNGVFSYDAVATPPDGVATQALESLDFELAVTITKGTTDIELRSETNAITRPHPPGC